ncbi:hypothetical protein Poli38472_006024 [Pythium oligandrum]|uniref:Uncharacterized protein n=1 Tax=Pythium oligandrum TaxID=41045 RepID=A0A8K1CRM9_PYTOL|nr:hypothetical protein Poli38472_006024 [Pythium oligandrum]|eukprot:TMW68556.1 hypothetical protein Poli38472_006024 [Pythium oligandrum]
MDVSALEQASSNEKSIALEAEWKRLVLTNGTTLTQRAFLAREARGNLSRVDSVFGIDDQHFLDKRSHDSRLPVAQFSGNALPLQRAVEMGSMATLVDFVHTNDVEKVNTFHNAHGETLLHTAVLHQHLDLVRVLLQHGADPNVALPGNGVSESTLQSAAPRSENFRFSRMLQAAEATPVHYACAVGNLDILKLLLAASKRFKHTEPFVIRRPGSLLVWAITAGRPAIVEFLLRKDLEQRCFDEDGNNAFGIASLVLGEPNASDILKQILKLLIQNDNFDINHKNMHGLTAYDVAEELHVKELLALDRVSP